LGDLAPVRVLGLGNVLMGDDAAGPWIIEALLAGWEFPEGVSVVDVGTPGLDLTPYLAEADSVILVDTVQSDATPGTVRVYSRETLFRMSPRPRMSPHDPGLTEALMALSLAGSAPGDVTLVGIVPGNVGIGVGLSGAARAAVPLAVAEVVARLTTLGYRPVPRPGAATATPWWEAAVAG
jgi:hydrogenase maturation protease